MKLFTQWRFILLAAFFSILGAGNVWAQLTELEKGKVYHFTNVGHDKAMGATVPNSVAGVNVDKRNYTQLWYVESTEVKNEVPCYTLRNLAFGTYLQGNGQSSKWTLATTTAAEASWILLSSAAGYNVIKAHNYGDYGFAHIDGSSNVVGWSTDASATQWTISKIDMSDDAIQAALGIFNNVATYQTALNDLFSDKACTTLKSGFSESNASFLALPTTLQNMVRKVADYTSWEEDYNNGKPAWDADYAKKYRVQLYEPYNEPECAAKALNLNAHTNLNNPTGIFANNGDVLYVMVEGEIKPGAELYLSYYTGQNRLSGATDGYELKQGLNVIPVYYDESNFCVNYVVHTFDTSEGKKGNEAKARKLSEYAPLKIHIEGGYINGYWNKMGDALYTADTDENWNYIEARATQKDIVVLGKYMTLKFPLLSEHAQGNSAMSQIYNDMVSVSASIAEWDNIMLWERFLMGLSTKAELDDNNIVSPYSSKTVFAFTGEDYTDYYNVHGLAINVEDNKNPHAGWDYTGYPNYSLKSVNADVIENAGAHWTAGHEIGHQHQGPLNMRGLTEVTNNLFSNVVLWCFGKSTSRYNGTDAALSNVLAQFNAEGTDFFSNNIWAQTIMYYKLFLYYHVLGHAPQFYPRLFEMLRQNPMIIEGDQDGSKCLMHFYKLCCDAAGADLTEFFRAHGFFEVMNSRFVGDYSSATYNLTQAQIDQAIAEVKTKGYPVNLAVLFINDATGEPILSHRDDVEYLELYGETRVCSEIGSYSNFNGDAANYTYGVAGNLVTMEGEGGVGFAILNEKGELIGFSDKKTFELSAEASAAIASGKASIVSIKGDNTPVVATNVMDSDNIGAKYELLGELLDNSKSILKRADATGMKVGFYRESALEGLQRAYDKAKEVYDAMNVAAYSSVYDVLFQEYVNIMSNEYARINITDGYAYRLTNKAYPDRSMAVNTQNHQMFGLATDESDAQLWYFEPGVTKNTYYLKNKDTGKYPGDVDSGKVLSADKSEADKGKGDGAYAYRLQEMQPGVFALVGETGLHCSASQSYNIVGWGADADASQWYITAIALDEALEARTKLEELIGKTEALVNEIAEYTLVNKLELQTEDNSAANYLSTNACHNTLNNATDGQGLAGLLDESTTTYFHSDYNGKVSDPHYLQVDLGTDHTVEQFKFNYTTRSNGNNCPISIKVEGSVDGSTFEELNTFTAVKDGLPNGNALSWESPVISNEGKYRHLRFTVTEAEGQNVYFVMSTFGVSDVTPVVNEIKEGYANDDASKTQIKATLYELANAHQLVAGDAADASEYNKEIKYLDDYYQELLKVVNNKLNAALDAKKAELQTKIDDANTLITECGTVTFTPGTFNGVPKLQTTDVNGKFYIWTNAQELDEGPIANLIDGDIQTYFHSDYSGTNSTDELDHHLTVNLGTGVTASSFQFSYTTRHNADTNYPTEIMVYGSTDGENYEEVTTITGLPTGSTKTYNSETITAEDKAFTHLRFMVTANNNTDSSKGIKGGHPIFHMAEFSLTIIGRSESYSVTLNNNIGIVDEALLVAAYKEKEEAVYVKENAITEAQIVRAIAQLQTQYDALFAAKNTITYITDLSQLSNTAVYGLSTSRGPLAYISGTEGALSTPKKGSDADIPANPTENEGEQFAILRTENTPAGKYYLYNLSKQRFVNTGAAFAENPVAVTSFSATSSNDYPWFVWLGDNERININKGNGLIMKAENEATPDEGNRFRIQYVKTDAEATEAALEAIIALETAVAEAQAFLDNTPNTVGYPVEAERTTLQDAIDGATDIATINDEVLDFKKSSNVNMPESGKAYVLKLKYIGSGYQGYKYMNVGDGNAITFEADDETYPESAYFVCRKDEATGRYYFVPAKKGGFLSYRSIATTHLASTCAWAVTPLYHYSYKDKINDKSVDNLWGHFCIKIDSRSASDGTDWALIVNESTDKFDYSTEPFLNGSYTSAVQLVEVPYTLNSVKMNALTEGDNQLLHGLEAGMSLSTFSAPYPTVTPEGVTAYYAETITEGESTTAVLKKLRTAIPAGEGVVLLGEGVEGNIKMLPATTEEVPAELNNFLKGTGAEPKKMSMDGTVDYILGRGTKGAGFYKAKAGSTLAAGKAYFHFGVQGARNFVLRFGGDTTDLDEVTLAPAVDDDAIYDLSGRRVNEVTKGGIYIKNGKKFIVK